MAVVLGKSDYLLDATLPLSVLRRCPQPPFDRHGHEFTELVLIVSGSALHELNDSKLPVHGGDVFVIQQGDEHEFTQLDQLHLINILCDPDHFRLRFPDLESLPGYRALFVLEPGLRQAQPGRPLLQLDPEALVFASSLIRRIETELKEKQPGFHSVATALFIDLAVFLSRCYSRIPHPQARELVRISESLSWLEAHALSPLPLVSLANKANLSVRHFQRLFKTITGTTPSSYQLSIKLGHAKELLESTNEHITQIAYSCGFNDSNYFCRTFLKHTGSTPGNWRKAQRELSRKQ